ncbi:MAG: hypothetical protein J0I40_13160 [Cellulomonas sp.]|uniref:hypothetical protein n=1 Tax=Cellulomonas sp. 73-92 TaxID=1895740 RepID=UPI00092A72ED|nr:hypothetical protein [Cellulomonas sp. 73-92]MBN9376310.1 hypothetical protein [Cellulomonas sp.]OJV76518.1 MAG: hypothetical protein BGO37_10700 [Cellulomonas sp. 73-92]
MLTQYAKAIAAIIAAALAVIGAAITDGTITPVEAVTIAIAILTAVVVYLVPNFDAGAQAYAKGVAAFLGAGLAALATVLASTTGWATVTLSDWITVALAALGGIGVVVVPNLKPTSAPSITSSSTTSDVSRT